jgi:ADP-heptose:LPS heptosyltransferase/predicted SAM-dependent methyltransferase
MWRRDDPQGAEALKIKHEIVPYTRGRGLDLGCGQWKLYSHFIGVDSGKQWGRQVTDVTAECDKLDMFASQSMDFVFSSHLLEHIDDYRAALKEWWRVIKPGGHLVLYLPDKKLYPMVGADGANPDHKHDFDQESVLAAMKETVGGFEVVMNELRDQDYGPGSQRNEYSFLMVFKKRADRKQNTEFHGPYGGAIPEKAVAVVRYGAFGDLIQCAGVFAGLKQQGYHVTLWTTPNGKQIIEHDPNIDEIMLQDKDQVPNEELGPFWQTISKRYDKFVNLSESVEGTWLAYPNRAQHMWPHMVREKLLNTNYLEFMHDLAGVPYQWPETWFYTTKEERYWARKTREKMRAEKVILYVLAGSSVHKKWPHMDRLIARVMIEQPDVHFVLVGGEMERILERGWEDEPRVHLRAGKWSIRKTMAFLDQCDAVFGPETGVLNAAAMMPMLKVVMLSHSSTENLTKHWVNTNPLFSVNVPCYPCHQMHYDFEHCIEHKESGTAMCQFDISCDAVYEALQPVFGQQPESLPAVVGA